MAENIYDEIEIEDMTYDVALEIYHYPCPCGDRFEIAIADLRDNEDIAVCPSCSLMIRVIFEVVSDLQSYTSQARGRACNTLHRSLSTLRKMRCPGDIRWHVLCRKTGCGASYTYL
jgi:diphthamide biosynthesis protein 3